MLRTVAVSDEAHVDAAWGASRLWFVIINVAFGPLVPLSYVWSAKRWPDHVGGLWGGIPEPWQWPYTANMFFAATGYLLFTWYVFRHGQRSSTALGRFSMLGMCLAYLAILVPSITWMPLTLHALATGSDLTGLIQVVLAIVALGSLAVSWALFSADAKTPWLRWARMGAVFFCLQTVLLDAIIWPRFFSVMS
jgi:hypothetical protein